MTAKIKKLLPNLFNSGKIGKPPKNDFFYVRILVIRHISPFEKVAYLAFSTLPTWDQEPFLGLLATLHFLARSFHFIRTHF